MADFLLELLSEEIPARMQAKARNDLARLFAESTSAAGLATGAVDVHSTPRRLVLIARDVAEATEASREEVKGPRTGAPPQALEGFREAVAECELCIEAKLPIPAYEQAIKASHLFNTLQARGVISVAERQAYIGRVRDLAKAACAAWMERVSG